VYITGHSAIENIDDTFFSTELVSILNFLCYVPHLPGIANYVLRSTNECRIRRFYVFLLLMSSKDILKRLEQKLLTSLLTNVQPV